MSRGWVKWLVAIGSGVLTIAAVDLGLRAVDGARRSEPLARALQDTVPPPPGTVVTLGGMIRLARDPRVIYELRPGLDVVYQEAPVVTDESGFRVWPDQPKPADGAFRIVGLGDSVMFGQAIRAEETYLHRLWKAVSARRRGRPVAVLNTAVPGYNTRMEVATLEGKGLEPKPDLVILDVVDNDLALPNFIRPPSPGGLFAGNGLWALVRELTTRDGRISAAPASPAGPWDPRGLVPTPPTGEGAALFADRPELAPPEYADFVGIQAVQRAIRDLRALSAEHSFDLVAVTLLAQDSPAKRQLRAAVEEAGVPWIDAGAAVTRYARDHHLPTGLESPLRANRIDNHPSGLWHEIAADEILKRLDELQMLPGNDQRGSRSAATRLAPALPRTTRR